MLAAIRHRGPDAEGRYGKGKYTAGQRRLSIVDLNTGDQPLFNGGKSVVLFYNGEIYNYSELRKGLEAKGYQFRTHSDGEVICHLYDEVGEELFSKLDGMFAIALWDEEQERLILARDLPGEKPLYYSLLSDHELVFASEIKSLRYFPGIDLSLNHQSIWDYPSFLWIPQPATIYASVSSLMPGRMLIADASGIRIKPYANPFSGHELDLCDDAIVPTTRSVVEKAVISRLLSDVPVGCFLSGGLDSSIVATIAAKNLPKLSTFTIGFEDLEDPIHGRSDESPFGESYAKTLGATHHTIHVTAKTFLENLETFCRNGDQPTGISSGLGILSVAEAARKAGIKVLLSGDGADECFGGYSWYEYLNDPLFSTPSGALQTTGDVSFQNFGLPVRQRIEAMRAYSPQYRAWAWHYYASEREKGRLFSRELANSVRPSRRFFDEFNGSDDWSAGDYIRQDRAFYLPNEMLTKLDRMTMAFSVEGRAPFVAPSVLALADKLEYRHMVRDGQLKWVLRRAFEDVLPEDVIRRPKHGFNVPIDHWLRGEWSFLVDRTFSADSALYKHGIIDAKSGDVAREMLRDRERLNGHSIFCFVILNMWMEMWG